MRIGILIMIKLMMSGRTIAESNQPTLLLINLIFATRVSTADSALPR
jgi:hypothetical protein